MTKYNIELKSELHMGDGSFERPIVRSALTLDELKESILSKHPESRDIVERQVLLAVRYLGKDTKFYQGQIMVDRELAVEVKEFFDFLLNLNLNNTEKDKLLLEIVEPIQSEKYNSDDETSMRSNNSSGTNFRFIKDSLRLSLHSFGFAVDFNPRENPVMVDGVVTQPQNGHRDVASPETLTEDHKAVQWLEDRGWEWGGRWQSFQDYHHFQKPLATKEYLDNLQVSLENGLITLVQYEEALAKANANSEKSKIIEPEFITTQL